FSFQDWPPKKNFKDEFDELYRSFTHGVPFPDITRPDGVLNLASHLPMHPISPDLGPKMYNAFGTFQDDCHHGSTRLHEDVTDAVNIMTFASPGTDGSPGGTQWVIFQRQDTPLLRQFLKESPAINYCDVGDPIHSQSIFVTSAHLQTLADEYNVRPFVFHQHPNEAVFIPAGCPHQVSNMTDSIKVAYDFVSVENLPTTVHLAEEYRRERLVKDGDDVLQIHRTLWDAWI
ncbi:hypothetical protein DENSPDRAFT_760878, partial [Dentipellis sp. KUC8613]